MSKAVFSLDVRRARKGDCLILHYGTQEEPGLALIDGGPSQVYKPFLKPRLIEIRKKRGLGDDVPLPVDLLMVSHIDDDHIKGILDLTAELVEASDAQRPPLVKVGELWHNSFDDIIGNDPQKLLSSVSASFGVTAALLPEVEAEGLDGHAAKVLASVAQGQRLRDDAGRLHLSLNREFKGKLIMASSKKALDMHKGLKFTVVGPMKEELAELQKEHDKFLKTQEKNKKATASFTDESAANLSSVVVLAEAGGKRMLLTGDARGDKIIEGLILTGLLKKGGKLHVDVLKVPHHGSDRNMETSFFETVTADHYVFSGNGEHGNPERATLQMLLDARGNEDLTIHLTYPIDEIDAGRKSEADKQFKAKKSKTPWSDSKDSLKAFFAKNPAFAKKVQWVDEKMPHVIDLLEGKVGF